MAEATRILSREKARLGLVPSGTTTPSSAQVSDTGLDVPYASMPGLPYSTRKFRAKHNQGRMLCALHVTSPPPPCRS